MTALLLAIAGLQTVNLLCVTSEEWRKIFSNLWQAGSGVGAAVLTWQAARELRRDGDEYAAGWRFIAIGMFFWMLGSVLFLFVEVVLKLAPFPGPPDIFFVLFYPAAIFGLWRLPCEPISRREFWNNLLDVAALGVVASLFVWQFNLRFLLRTLATEHNAGALVSLGYTLLDTLFLLVIFWKLVGKLGRGRQFTSLLLLVIGCFFLISADLLEGYVTTYGNFTSGSPIDMGWVLFSVCSGLAALHLLKHDAGQEADRVPNPQTEMFRTTWIMAATYLWMAMALGMLVWALFHREDVNIVFLLSGIMAATLLAVTRQIRTLRENNQLYQQVHLAHTELETKVLERTAQLQRQGDSLRHYEDIIQSCDDAIISETVDGKITSWNFGAENIYGYAAAEVLGCSMTRFVPPELEPEAADILVRIKRGERILHYETRHLRKDGAIIHISATISPIHDGGGEIMGSSIVARDITKNRTLESQLRQAQKMEAIGTLAGGIAHDFNNILAAMFGFVELLKEDVAENPTALENVNEIHHATKRAADLVRQILTFSRQQAQHRQVVRLDTVVKEAVKFLRASLPAGIKIELRLAADAPAVLADPTQIYQVVLNLATNSFHAMQSHNACLTISLDPFEADAEFMRTHPEFSTSPYTRLLVADTGQGMDAATLQRIFEPFFTTKPVGRGTGLGLSVVHGIIQSHAGKITVASQPGSGTTFGIYFPAQESEAAQPAEAAAKAPLGQGQKILVVDDEIALTAAYQRMLQRLNYQAITCNHPQAALQLFSEAPHQFAAIITDLTMPEMNGVEVIRRIRKIRSDVPIILATGLTSSASESAVADYGADGILEKPFASLALAETLHRVFHRHPA